MSVLITRIGRRDDPKRSKVRLEPRACGSFGGTVKREDFHVGTYGNSLRDALQMSFYWAGIRLRTILDDVNDLAKLMEGQNA